MKYKEDLAMQIAAAGPCECCGKLQNRVGSACHPESGVEVIFTGNSLIMVCIECGDFVEEIAVASRNNESQGVDNGQFN